MSRRLRNPGNLSVHLDQLPVSKFKQAKRYNFIKRQTEETLNSRYRNLSYPIIDRQN